MKTNEILTVAGSLVNRDLIGVKQSSLDKIMNGVSDVLEIVVKDNSTNKTVDDLKGGQYVLDTTGVININTYSITLTTEAVEKLKRLLQGKKVKIDFKSIRFTYNSAEVTCQADNQQELLEALSQAINLISKNS